MIATNRYLLSAAAVSAALLVADRAASAAGSQPDGAATATTVKLPSGPGSVRGLAGDPSVNVFTGQASYAVALELPKSARGFAPAAALQYHGDLGNGPLGIGWNVDVPAIRRSTRQGVPNYLPNFQDDELELSGVGAGGRLVAIPSGEWRIEGLANAIRIIAEGSGFVAFGPDGTRYRFGIAAGARHESGSKIAAWMIEEIIDVAGQRVAFSYKKDRGALYLEQIAWGPNDALKAAFEHQARADVVTSYRTGFEVTTGLRVAAVRVESFGEVVRRYELGYDEDFAISRLTSVRMLGRSRPGEIPDELPLLTFRYAERNAQQPQVLDVGNWRLDANTVLLDVDSDGAADLLRFTGNGHEVRQNRAGAFAPAIAMPGAGNLTLAGTRLADIEGKSRANLIAVVNNAWQPFRIKGSSWEAMGTWSGTANVPIKGNNVVLADLDGDGRVDVVQWSDTGLIVRFATSAGFDAPVTRPRIAGTVLPGTNIQWHDVNGDGLSDAVLLQDSSMNLYLGRGDGTFTAAKTVSWPWTGGLANQDVRFADLDRDGLLDLVRVALGNVDWHQGRADNTFDAKAIRLAQPDAVGVNATVAFEDINGNGSWDAVWSSPNGVWALDLAGATNAGMLVGIDNGLGKTVDLEYDATTALAGRDANAGNPWTFHLPIAIAVVTKTRIRASADEGERIFDYTLRDGFWDLAENRFGGFLIGRAQVEGGPNRPDSIEETRFHPGIGNSRVLRGKPVSVRVENGAGNLVTVTSNVWRAHQVTGMPATAPLLRRAVCDRITVAHHEGMPADSPLVTRTTFTFDGEGRTTGEVHEGRIDLTGDEKKIERSYASDDTLWVRDQLVDEKLLTGSGTVIAHKRQYYGDHQTVLPLGQIGRGWLRRAESFFAEENRWVTQSERDYDALGNPVRTKDAGIERRVVYDTHGLFPLHETLATGSADLVWSFEWDQVQGLATAMTGPDGVTARVGYDGLGRVKTEAVGDSLPHRHNRYLWTAPRPVTESFIFDGPLEQVTALPSPWEPASHWRHEINVTNGAGESLYAATRLAEDRWTIAKWTERDPMGRPTFMGEAVEVTGDPRTLTRPDEMVGQTVVRDALGRVLEQTLPDGTTKRFQYRALSTTSTAPDLAPVTIVSDGLGRIIENRRESELAQARYDAAGRVTAYDVARASQVITQTFGYDSLGRMRQSQHPEGGLRTFTYDDGGRMLRETNATGQHITITYDQAGRPLTRVLDDGTGFAYHYDTPHSGQAQNTGGKLAWIEEPTGRVEIGYNTLGRISSRTRIVDGISGTVATTFTASGLPLSLTFDNDAFSVALTYDPAGRLIQAGELWTLNEQDAAGRVMVESFGNGVRQTFARDELGRSTRIDIGKQSGPKLFGAAIARNAWGGITAVDDDDGAGSDHDAGFSYDLRGRLTGATIGSGVVAHSFAFAFDDFQNMTSRTATGPTQLGALTGTYRYAEGGATARQLTSIADSTGTALHTFAYDAAGRQTTRDQMAMTFNALDQLLRVNGAPGGSVAHAYGYDGQRVKTTQPDGSIKRWLGDEISVDASGREYFITIGERQIARVRISTTNPAAAASTGALGFVDPRFLWIAVLAAAALALGAARRSRHGARRPLWLRGVASVCVLIVFAQCSGFGGTGAVSQAVAGPQIAYFHHGIAPGPILFTDQDGAVLEERRYEPFGEPIDARGANGPLSAPDFKALDRNALNKPVDPATGWSFHGARWLATESARWLSVDPPTVAPNPGKYMAEPWSLNPYQYVDQNPVVYWDPDGRDKAWDTPMGIVSVSHDQKPIYMGTSSGGSFRAPIKIPDDGITEVRLTFVSTHHFQLNYGQSFNMMGHLSANQATVTIAANVLVKFNKGVMTSVTKSVSAVDTTYSATLTGPGAALGIPRQYDATSYSGSISFGDKFWGLINDKEPYSNRGLTHEAVTIPDGTTVTFKSSAGLPSRTVQENSAELSGSHGPFEAKAPSSSTTTVLPEGITENSIDISFECSNSGCAAPPRKE